MTQGLVVAQAQEGVGVQAQGVGVQAQELVMVQALVVAQE
jgi:hypothetical protein